MRALMVLACLLWSAAALAAEPVEAILTGHAVWPADSFVEPTDNAPAYFLLSGRWLEGRRGTPEFEGQPVQGFSELRRAADGGYWVLGDNGFGAKGNSADALLMLHRMRIDWEQNSVSREETVFLNDRNHRIAYPIVSETSASRFLTGADFDIESLVVTEQALWIGEEFYPALAEFEPNGTLRAVHPLDNRISPDYPGGGDPQIARSRGFEGLTAFRDGRLLAMLEAPLVGAEAAETLMLEFDPAAGGWTGRVWRYVPEDAGHAIGAVTMLDEDFALVIERDWEEGAAAVFKRLYRIRLPESPGVVEKLDYVDLVDIADPRAVAQSGSQNGRFRFPFVTIEAVEADGAGGFVLVNDNNYPFSRGRDPELPDNSEFIRIRVPAWE